MTIQEEDKSTTDKPTPSGRPRPGIEPEKKEEEIKEERRLHPGRFQRKTLAGATISDIRFWIFICGMLVGILIGLAF